MSKNAIEKRLETIEAVLVVTFLIAIFCFGAICFIAKNGIEGHWECVEWKTISTPTPEYCMKGINCSRPSTEWIETCESFEYSDSPECIPIDRSVKICIKEQFVREVN